MGLSAEAATRFGGVGGGNASISRSASDYGGYRDDVERHERDDDYDGEKEDSDNDSYNNRSGGGGRRYHDRERPKSPVTTAPTSIDKKAINLNFKTNPKVGMSKVTTPNTATTKKIDLGAASNYGKGDLCINSPTHRNTHSEDLFTDDTAPAIIDDDDDFNPRAEEFGDFETAFGKVGPAKTPKSNGSDDFADFAAFTAPPAAPVVQSSNTDLLAGLSGGAGSTDLFGSFATAPVAPISIAHPQTADLLADFGGLALGQETTGKSNFTFTFPLMVTLAWLLTFFHVPTQFP